MKGLTACFLLILLGVAGCHGSDGRAGQENDVLPGSDSLFGDGSEGADSQVPEPIDWDAFFASSDWLDDGLRRVVILHTNDLHSHHNGSGPLADYTPEFLDGDGTRGGFARLASLLERERRDLRPGADLLVLDAGDFTFGSAFTSLAQDYSTELRFMASAGYHATTLGNHELDWTPPGVAALLDNGLDKDGSLVVLASNLIFSEDDSADDDLAALLGEKLHRYRVFNLPGGVRIGLFGILGKTAFALAPKATPVTLQSPKEAAAEMVNLLREQEQVDLVICLSHSGVGDDEKLAASVDGIDVIIGGHSHTLLEEPIVVNDTIIVQAGYFGSDLGKLVLVEADGQFGLESWETQPVYDEVPGRPEMIADIQGWEDLLDDHLVDKIGLAYRESLARTDFDLPTAKMAESTIGDLVTDAIRVSTGKIVGTIDVSLEANGVIREGLFTGISGHIQVGDAIRVLPTGIGPELSPGYPMCAFYLTAADLKLAAEVTAGIAPMISDSFFLQVSGMRFEYDPDGKLLEQVTAVYLGNDVDGYSDEPLDVSDANTTLYHVATNLYLGEMLEVLKEFTGGLLAIEPRKAGGEPVTDILEMLVDADSIAPGVQEFPVWQALIVYLQEFPVDESSGLPTVPSRYNSVGGRIILSK
jgi:5'-nucleotidase / UDP-sugar diphosphatase